MIEYRKLDAEAGQNLSRVQKELDGLQMGKTASAVYKTNAGPSRKIIALQLIADKVNDLVVPVCACNSGCSHCCNIAVTVSRPEAVAISIASGRPMTEADTSDYLGKVEGQQQEFMGEPCPFLVDNRCSVYLARPLTCKIYFNLSSTPEVCDVVKYPKHSVPGLNMMPMVQAQVLSVDMQLADIRDWFPTKE